MSSEKQTDGISWRNKLNELDSLPETSIDKNIAWEKLDGRLHPVARSNKSVWYWAAAGIIAVLLIAVTLLLQNRKTDALVKNMPPSKKTDISPAHNTVAHEQHRSSTVSDLITTYPILSIIKKHTRSGTKTSEVLAKTSEVSKNFRSLPSLKPSPAASIAIASAPAAVPALAIAAIPVPVKKQLRIVHLNELDAAPVSHPEQLAVSTGHEQKNFSFKLGNNRILAAPAADRPNYAGVVQITLTN